MPVTIHPVAHKANSWVAPADQGPSAKNLLYDSCATEFPKIANENSLQSSFGIDSNANILASGNGFAEAVLRAHDQHHHLILRPDDVWLTILVHLNVYINEHDEELRSFFVAHEGQKPLRLWSDEFLRKDRLYD